MVFRKKANTSMKKQFQQKKGKKIPQQIADNVDLDDCMDDDDSGDSEEQIQTTSFNKTPKGKNEKRVSFKVEGGGSAVKATPAKTPKRNSLVPKKPSTPAAKSKQTKRPAQDDDDDDEDDDDDDEEDDDFDMQGLDMDDSDAEDDDVDDMDEEDDDEADEEDDDEADEEEDDDEADEEEDADEADEEEEDDDDNEEEEQHTKKNGKSVNVKLEKQKNTKQTKKLATPKAKTSDDSKKAEQEKGSPAKIVALNLEERKQPDACNLFIKYLPKDVVAEELKKMSPDILNVFLPAASKVHARKLTYAFLQFESEAKAEANRQILQTKEFRGQFLNIDYAGEKSESYRQFNPGSKYDMKKLHISSLPVDTTLAQVVMHFPKARFISLNESPVNRWATIGYASETDAAEDVDKAKGLEIEGHKVIVEYFRITRVKEMHNRSVNKSWAQNYRKSVHPAKKVKLSTS